MCFHGVSMETRELGFHTLQWQLGFHALYENMRWEPKGICENTKYLGTTTWELLKLNPPKWELSLGNGLLPNEVRYTKIV